MLEELNRVLALECKRLKASACTFYVRDKHWKNELRLAAMCGVSVHETMHGLLYPVPSRDVVTGGDLEEYIDQRQRAPDLPEEYLRDIPLEHRHLFQDFAHREGIQKAARLKHTAPDGDVDAVLFVNYRNNIRFDRNRKRDLKRLLQHLTSGLEGVREALSADDALWLSEAARVVSPTLSVVNIDLVATSLDDYFTKILESTISAFGIDDCLGTMHTFDAEEQALSLHGHVGDLHHLDRAQHHSVAKGQGVVSWVARRQRALLISDLSSHDSTFRKVHVWLNDNVRSELAIPIEAGGELIGVMCFESETPNAFRPHHVRSAWYAANRAAIFYQLRRQTLMTAALLDLCSDATSGIIEAKTVLKRLAVLARDYLKASYSDISCFSPETGEFVSFAATYGDVEPRARRKGWTQFCRRVRVPIWIDAQSKSQYSIHHWNGSQWISGPPGAETAPSDLNDAAFADDVRCQLGVPLIVKDEAVGVAWLRYKRPRMQLPQLGLMTPALGFAAHGALVLQSIVDSIERKRIDVVAQSVADEMKIKWQSQSTALIDLYPFSEAFRARQGGDLYSLKQINQETNGIFLLDGEGHSTEGLLHMMPILSAFESCWNSCSAAHVLNQLRSAAVAAGVRGNALYYIVTKIKDTRWMIVSAAGNVFMIRFRRNDLNQWYYEHLPREYGRGPMLGVELTQPQLDERVELHPGDLIVTFTDGIAQHDEVGFVAEIVNGMLNHGVPTPREIAEAVVVKRRAQHEDGFRDDVTIVVGQVR